MCCKDVTFTARDMFRMFLTNSFKLHTCSKCISPCCNVLSGESAVGCGKCALEEECMCWEEDGHNFFFFFSLLIRARDFLIEK